MARNESLSDIRKDVERNYATCYWSEDSLTKDGRIPRERTIEPARFLERIARALMRNGRYVWMLTVEGSSHGDYENNASSSLFCSFDEAKKFVENDIRECIIQDRIVNPSKHTEEDISEAIAGHVYWFGDCQVQYRYNGSVTDWKIEKIRLP